MLKRINLGAFWKEGSRIFWIAFCVLFMALIFFLLMYYHYPFREVFEFDPDEGQNAMISLMINRGYSMYSEIWSDHPPLFPYLLDFWLRIFGYEIYTARVLVLFFSTILLASAYQFLREAWGTWHAVAGLILIILLPYYTRLSVSLMIGLPSIAFAICAIYALQLWHRKGRLVWLIISGILLVSSLFIKLFTIILVPIFILGIYLDERHKQNQKQWIFFPRSLATWFITTIFVGIVLGLLLIGPRAMGELVNFYLQAASIKSYLAVAKIYDINWFLRESLPLFVLAAIGSVFAIIAKNWGSLYLTAWTILAYITLLWQIPVWYHHQLLVTIPTAMLAGVTIGQSIDTSLQLFRTKGISVWLVSLAIISMALLIFVLVERVPETMQEFSTPDTLLERERMFLVRSSNHAAETEWFVTDTPMYAFRIKASVPPSLAVFSDKRILTGGLSEEQILVAIAAYRPEQVFIGRFNFPAVRDYLQEDYRLLYERGKRALYLRQ